MPMGRNFEGLHIGKKTDVSVKPNGNNAAHIAPRALPTEAESNDSEVEYQIEDVPLPFESGDSQDVLVMKNHDTKEKVETPKSSDKKLIFPVKSSSTSGDSIVDQSHVNGAEDGPRVKVLTQFNDAISPTSAKKSQPTVSSVSRKQMLLKGYYDDDDNCSLASSTTSVRTRVTVPVAPRFAVDRRLERRKEFYTKLEEKHSALEKERREYEARTKEEEQAAIKLLRKTMAYKANPVPSFYKEGPPPKVELKKLPVTRPKSPNLNRRKSCSDAMKSSPEICARAPRHSIGSYKESKSSPIAPKSKDQSGVRRSNGTTVKPKETVRKPKEKKESPSVEEKPSNEKIARVNVKEQEIVAASDAIAADS